MTKTFTGFLIACALLLGSVAACTRAERQAEQPPATDMPNGGTPNDVHAGQGNANNANHTP